MIQEIKTMDDNSLFIVEHAYAGSVVYPPGGKLGSRIQQDLQLVMLYTGSMDIHVDGVHNKIPVGHVTLLKPGHTEKFNFSIKEETWHRWISISIRGISKELLSDIEKLPSYIPVSERMNELTSLMLAISRDHQNDNNQVICSLGQSAILLYMMECQNQYRSYIHPAVLKAKEMIQEKFAEDLSLKDISKESNISPEHLIRLFQKHVNMTPVQYLWLYRVNCGVQLLRSTGLQIGEIAFQTGFKSSYHFSRAVKKHIGSTPSEIRNESRKPS
ncbi:AraC family transcriptional regulator [Bacillus sp. FSL K6-3431]|uniref:AraC family transcriptional regulator n=1 Tax=Bacillus sp. FSL K6-3431 TaxID=2921500 RepID=UPI0030FB8033